MHFSVLRFELGMTASAERGMIMSWKKFGILIDANCPDGQ
jgi:hypothetical protein